MKFNYHTHTTYSDGHQTCAQAIDAAIESGFDILGFSDHGSVPFKSSWNIMERLIQNYFNEIEQLQKLYTGKIELFKGLEADYVDTICDLNSFRPFNFDYIIGSVHYFPFQFDNGIYFNFDTTEKLFVEGLNKFYAGDIQKMVTSYYKDILKMLTSCAPDIIGHLDIIGKFNKYCKFYNPDQQWHKNLVEEVLNEIAVKNCIVEVNARRKYRDFHEDVSPSTNILKQVLKKNIPITISGDIHNSTEFALYWEDTIKTVSQIGFKEILFLDHQGWHNQTL